VRLLLLSNNEANTRSASLRAGFGHEGYPKVTKATARGQIMLRDVGVTFVNFVFASLGDLGRTRALNSNRSEGAPRHSHQAVPHGSRLLG
jgi:hypothetical protein